PGLLEAGVRALFELIGQGEQQRDDRLLVAGLDFQDVPADALGLQGLVQEAVPVRFLQGRGDGLLGEGLQLEHGCLLRPQPRKARKSFLTGSKNWSTTRSFNGMMALSV